MNAYSVTRKQILDAASTMIGLPFVHQGRSAATGVDCVGLLAVMLEMVGYPGIYDVEGYRRTPSAKVIRETLELNFDSIPVGEVGPGDIYLMRVNGIKPRHASICYSVDCDPIKGKEPMVLHATRERVRLEPKRNFPEGWFVAGFRLKGLVD